MSSVGAHRLTVKHRPFTLDALTRPPYTGLVAGRRLLTLSEVAQILGVTRQGVWDAARRGRLKALQKDGRWFVRPEDLLRYVAETRRDPNEVERIAHRVHEETGTDWWAIAALLAAGAGLAWLVRELGRQAVKR